MTVAFYGIVRAADGTPKFDDPENVPLEVISEVLTPADFAKMPDHVRERLGKAHGKSVDRNGKITSRKKGA